MAAGGEVTPTTTPAAGEQPCDAVDAAPGPRSRWTRRAVSPPRAAHQPHHNIRTELAKYAPYAAFAFDDNVAPGSPAISADCEPDDLHHAECQQPP